MTVIPNRPTRRRLLASRGRRRPWRRGGARFILRAAGAQSWAAGDPFSLGVASGAPRPDGFVLWTRLAPEPLSPDPANAGRHARRRCDRRLRDRDRPRHARHRAPRRSHRRAGLRLFGACRRARPRARPALLVSLHERRRREPRSDAPRRCRRRSARWSGCASGSSPARNYEHGYFSAYRHLADENPEFVLFLGDYIYENIEQNRPTVRRHSDGIEAATLPTYRNRYAQYRLDADLQRLHAQVPALVTWDDHEVANDYADKWSRTFRRSATVPDAARRGLSGVLRAHAGAADPVAARTGRSCASMTASRFGDLIEISMIDGRQYRSREACYAPPVKGGGHLESDASCPERREAGRTMMGFAQEAWLASGLAHSKATVECDRPGRADGAVLRQKQNDAFGFWTDDWDGYPANRTRLLKRIAARRRCQIRWCSAATSIRSSPTTCGSISTIRSRRWWRPNSSAPRSRPTGRRYELIAQALPDNPHVRFFESRRRGYVSVDLERAHMQVQMRVISDAHDPQGRRFDAEDFCGRERQARRGDGLVQLPPSHEVRRRGQASSEQPDTCPYRRAFARHLPRVRGEERIHPLEGIALETRSRLFRLNLLGQPHLDQRLVRHVALVGCDFDAIQKALGQAKGNRSRRQFQIGKLHPLCFAPIYIVGRIVGFQNFRSSASVRKFGIGLSFFLLIDGSFFPVHIVGRNYPNACSVAAKRKRHMQRPAYRPLRPMA